MAHGSRNVPIAFLRQSRNPELKHFKIPFHNVLTVFEQVCHPQYLILIPANPMKSKRSLNDYGDNNSEREALDPESLKSVLVLAIHQLTYARFSPDRLFADEKQAWIFEVPF